MRPTRGRLTLLLILATLCARTPLHAAKPIPPAPFVYVYNEGVVSQDASEQLSRLLKSFELQTGHQFVIGLFQSLDSESIEDYTNRVFKDWKIGGKKNNDGLLFCLFLKDHRWRVEVGYGLEGVITDLEGAEIARQAGVPYFKEGDFETGILAVAGQLAIKMGGSASIESTGFRNPGLRRLGGPDASSHSFPIMLLLLLLSLIFHYPMFGMILLFSTLHLLDRMASLGRSNVNIRGSRRGGRIFHDNDWWTFGGGGWGSGGGGWGGGGSDLGGFIGGGGSSGGGGASGDW